MVCKNIPLQNGRGNIPEFIENLMKKDTQNIDVCIQHVLPNMVIGTKKFKKNILCTHIDTEISEHHSWYHYLNMVDEVWVNNQDSLDNLKILELQPSSTMTLIQIFIPSRQKNRLR